MKKKIIIGAIGVILVVTLIAAILLRPAYQQNGSTSGASNEQIGLIHIEGTIMSGSSNSIFGYEQGMERVKSNLQKAAKDDEIEVLLIRMNTPGGSAAASQEIRDGLNKVKESGKKVVVSMADVSASGGYWIASGADVIVANPATITGSIGVIMTLQNFEDLLDKIGIDTHVFKSGDHKDIGSPTRELTPNEETILQSMIDDIFDQFVEVIAEGRNLPKEEVMEIADGRIFTGRQAKDLGLIDELGDFYYAVDIAAELAGIEGEPVLKQYHQPTTWDRLLWGVNHIVYPFGKDGFRIDELLKIHKIF